MSILTTARSPLEGACHVIPVLRSRANNSIRAASAPLAAARGPMLWDKSANVLLVRDGRRACVARSQRKRHNRGIGPSPGKVDPRLPRNPVDVPLHSRLDSPMQDPRSPGSHVPCSVPRMLSLASSNPVLATGGIPMSIKRRGTVGMRAMLSLSAHTEARMRMCIAFAESAILIVVVIPSSASCALFWCWWLRSAPADSCCFSPRAASKPMPTK